MTQKFTKFLVSISFIFVFFGVSASLAQAATLSLSPSSGTYSKGSSFTVSVLVSSTDKTMNAASGLIAFPTDLLSVSSISKTGSIVDFWAQDPSFSNTAGTIDFESVLLPPGFTGSSGKLITITFKAKASGTANLNFTSGSVLAADGVGTDILTYSGTASFKITAGNEPVIIPPVADNGTPQAPLITSSTHPDQTQWYALKDAIFSWGLTKDVTGVSVLIGRNAKSSPTVLYSPPISTKEVKDLDDGVWYFHVQLRNDNGWSAVSDFKLQIDTEKPTSFDITEIKRNDLTDPKAKFAFNAVDKTSGIDHYEVQIDSGPIETWKDDGTHIYKTRAMEGGVHTMLAKAVDKAGNFLLASVDFIIQSLEAPIITDYSKDVQSDSVLTVSGTTKYPNSEAEVFLKDEKGIVKKYSSNADKDGNFTIISNDRLRDGLYTAWVQVIDSRGARSLPSEKVTISVNQSALIRIGNWAISFLSVLIPLIVLILLLASLLWYAWRRFFLIGKKVRDAESALHKAFDLLKEGAREHIKTLNKTSNKRELTNEEEKILKQLGKDLDDAEKILRKEIEDIEK